jgi:1,2-diacylglycerol 3-alpha-glucosyltransferase
MHIGLVTASYVPVINGVTRMVALYKKHLEAAGHQVTVFTFGEVEQWENDPTIVRSPGHKLSNSGYYFAFRYSPKAQELLSQVDIIHCHHLIMGLEHAQRYGRAPIVYTNHTRYDLYARSYMRLPDPIARGFLRLLWPWMTGYCDIVVAPSASVKRLLRTFGVRQPIEVIANGIEVERFRHPVNPLTKEQIGVPQTSTLVIYIGRLAGEKNLEKLLYEFSLAEGEVPPLYLLLVGSGPAQEKLFRLATKLNIANRVVFRGAVAHHEIPRYLAASDIFVTASQSEVLPLTIIEAMAAGLPVAAIKSPGIDDLIEHGKTGILTSFQNGDLARSILFLAGDKSERARLGHNSYQESRHYHINHTVGHTIQLYKRLLGENNREHTNEGRDENKILGEHSDSKSYQSRAYEDFQ